MFQILLAAPLVSMIDKEGWKYLKPAQDFNSKVKCTKTIFGTYMKLTPKTENSVGLLDSEILTNKKLITVLTKWNLDLVNFSNLFNWFWKFVCYSEGLMALTIEIAPVKRSFL